MLTKHAIWWTDRMLRTQASESNFGTRDAETLLQDCGHDILSVCDVDESLSPPRLPRQIDTLFTDIYLKKAVLGGYELAAGRQSTVEFARTLYDRH